MFVRALPTFLVLFALLALTVDARPWRGTVQRRKLTPEERSLTNSERFARGLPPRAPVINRIIPGREPTPVKRGAHSSASASASPSPSPSPSPSAGASSFSGRIEVFVNETVAIGFVENSATGVGPVDLESVSTLDLAVKLSTTGITSSVSILATNAIFQGPVFIGGSGNATLSSTSSGYVNITNVPQTKSGAPPTPSGASAIWSINKSSGQLSAQWVNLDGSKPNTTIAYATTGNYLFLTGNLTEWIAAANTTAEAVELFLVK